MPGYDYNLPVVHRPVQVYVCVCACIFIIGEKQKLVGNNNDRNVHGVCGGCEYNALRFRISRPK